LATVGIYAGTERPQRIRDVSTGDIVIGHAGHRAHVSSPVGESSSTRSDTNWVVLLPGKTFRQLRETVMIAQ
jgi:hypothetical protein